MKSTDFLLLFMTTLSMKGLEIMLYLYTLWKQSVNSNNSNYWKQFGFILVTLFYFNSTNTEILPLFGVHYKTQQFTWDCFACHEKSCKDQFGGSVEHSLMHLSLGDGKKGDWMPLHGRLRCHRVWFCVNSHTGKYDLFIILFVCFGLICFPYPSTGWHQASTLRPCL